MLDECLFSMLQVSLKFLQRSLAWVEVCGDNACGDRISWVSLGASAFKYNKKSLRTRGTQALIYFHFFTYAILIVLFKVLFHPFEKAFLVLTRVRFEVRRVLQFLQQVALLTAQGLRRPYVNVDQLVATVV